MPTNQPTTRLVSPLRYPGGKGSFYPYIAAAVRVNGLVGGAYYEPFAGGAGVALGLLSDAVVQEIVLNDIDYHVYCFWHSAIYESNRFIDRVASIELSISEWHKQKDIYRAPDSYSIFEVGFSTFYLNRCNRSGILSRSGPIGGNDQSGKWKIDARFNRQTLISRLRQIADLSSRITVCNMDAVDFLKHRLPRGNGRQNVFVYIDPPYVTAGERLYVNHFTPRDHKFLAEYLVHQRILKWIVTYDDGILIRNLYSSCQEWLFSLGYSLQSKQQGKELIIAPQHITLPEHHQFAGRRWNILGNVN
jgi:DNA adenine methylase